MMGLEQEQVGKEGSCCTNRVVFFEDPEAGNSNHNDDTGNEGMGQSGSVQNKISIVGPLPDDKERPKYSSDFSVNSSIANGGGGLGRIQGTSILKQRNNEKRKSKSSGSTNHSTGSHSGLTGSWSFRSRSTHSSGGSSGSSSLYTPHAKATPRPIWYGRWLFFTLLCLVAITLGYMTYDHLSANETKLADCVFEKVAENAIKVISGNQKKKKLGMDTLASMIGSTGYDQTQWPYVALNDYESTVQNVIDVSKGCYIAYGPILTPTQVPSFEFFAADWYQKSRIPEPFPDGTGIKVHDQVGVWGMKDGAPFHDVSGATAWDSKRRIVVPMFQHVTGASKKLMFNMHSSPLLGGTIEEMMTCAEETKELILEHERKYSDLLLTEDDGEAEVPPPAPSLKDCTMVTNIAHNKTSFVQGEPTGPGANMMQPIFPARDSTEMVGVLVTSIVWSENMVDVFAANIDGVYIVISTPTEDVSYQVIKGNVTFIGSGDHHDPKYEYAKKVGNVTIPGLFAPQSVPYTITLYPSDTVYEMYRTKNPKFATIGAICVMFFTVLMFLAYDFLVRREFSAKAELLKAKRHFMRYVSHEVRTPLNSVCMGLNLMQEEIQSKLGSTDLDGSKNASITIEEATSWLNLSRDVHISAQSATNVLNDFLNYDKIESRQLSLELSVIPIQSLVSEISKEFVLPAQEKSIHFLLLQEKVEAAEATPGNNNSSTSKVKNSIMKPEMDRIDEIESELLEDQVVVGDRARLSQVVRNVISNAIKFTPKKGSITVKTTWMVATVGESTSINLQDGRAEDLHQTGWIQLEVTDTGPGMTEEQLATVFESGVQFNANKNQKGGGSGLGLFIAKGIVDQHNGTLTVHSDGLDKGSSFLCKLPLFCKPKERGFDNIPVAPRDETITERVSSTWLDNQNKNDLCYRILVVDDAPMNRKLLTRLLLKRGHHVDMAEDGMQAYERVKEEMKEGRRYDTILMDFQMPVMDGPTATQQIRMEGCDSFIVGITGNVLPQDVEHFKFCGADGVLGKPFQVEELESMWVEYGVTSG